VSKNVSLIGQKFGKLTVLYKDEIFIDLNGKHRSMWHCRCECGREKSIRRDGLTSGRTKSCGMCSNDLTGKKYDRLTALYKIKTDNVGHAVWRCRCDCGNDVDVYASNLIRGYTKSCGCLRSEAAKAVGERVRERNKYDLSGDFGIGWTSNTNNEFYFDIEDYDIIKNYHWAEKGDEGYIVTKVWNNNQPSTVFMHRLIMQENGFDISTSDVDHKNHKTYDNQKSNLRVCKHHQNITASRTYSNNTSGRKGVSWDKTRNKWIVSITYNKKTYHIGRFENFDDAVKAREEAEKIYHKDFHYDDLNLEVN